MANRVFITGYGQLSPLGSHLSDFDLSLAQSHSKIVEYSLDLPGLDPAIIPVCPVVFPLDKIVAPSRLPLDRCTAMALKVAQDAVSHAKLDPQQIDNERLGIYWGSGMAGAGSFDKTCQALYVEKKRVRPTSVVTTMPNAPAAEIALLFKARGASLSFACACASSAVAIGEALRALRSGQLDVAIVGGSEAMLTPGVIASWHALRVLASVKSDMTKTFFPFSVGRNGFALGEGAAAFVLETEAHARARQANIGLQLSGYATNCDGQHMTNPHPQGQVKAMKLALQDAQLEPRDIGYLNAHGTATVAGDLCEAESISTVFTDFGVPVSSTKGLHGHLLGAGGAVELLVAIRALETQRLPAINEHLDRDPKINLDLVIGQSRSAPKIQHAMSNSFAFGGTNGVLIASLV
jgi:3-oxoacyl-[acyl-carrier-protein] synthase II